MTYATPCFTRPEVRRAGEILCAQSSSPEQLRWATEVLTNWRASHGYLLNTFQSTLRAKLRYVDKTAIVGQRLKRAPSVIAKLRRFNTMKLHQMQDIAGLRAVVDGVPKLRKLHEKYVNSRLSHDLVNTKNYMEDPKDDGYRSIHLVYRYANPRVPAYDNLHVELQLRTKLQHAWATAVETVDAFLGESIKAGRPGEDWAEFFGLASAAFARVEGTSLAPTFRNLSDAKLLQRLKRSERSLGVLLKLRGFSVAANNIDTHGKSRASYHLVILNTEKRNVIIRSFPLAEQDAANREYARMENRALAGEPIDPVLVTGGTVHGLRKAYPNYFLDTQSFVTRTRNILNTNSFS